jgi:hypothetical protein
LTKASNSSSAFAIGRRAPSNGEPNVNPEDELSGENREA